MKYSSWMLKKDLIETLKQKEQNKGGKIPLIHESNQTYGIDISNTVVIGSSGSGKTQNILLPTIKNIIENNESLIIKDTKGEIQKEITELLKTQNYNIIELSFEDENTIEKWNPFHLATILYKENKKDQALEILQETMEILFQKPLPPRDPFWIQSSINLAIGSAMHLLEQNKYITLKEIYQTAQKLIEESFKNLDQSETTYLLLSEIIVAPQETQNSILATFNQEIKKYIIKTNISKITSTTSFDLNTIKTQKTALIITNTTSELSNILTSTLITQIIKSIEIYNQKENKLNIILDNFDELAPIKNYSKILLTSRKYHINNLITIKGLVTLEGKYSKEDIRLVGMNINNIIYLYTQDIRMLKEISIICGEESKHEPLITVEELQRLKQNEAIIKLPRLNPIRIDLIPDYKQK